MDDVILDRLSENSGDAPVGTSVERRVIDICSQFINSNGIGPDDNLIELGASSLMLICVLAKVQDAFEVEFDPMATAEILFSTPTPRVLAGYVCPRLAGGRQSART